MSTKSSSSPSTSQSLATMDTDLSERKTDGQVKQLNNVGSSSHMHTDIKTSTSASAANLLTSSVVQSDDKLSNEDVSMTLKLKPKHKCHHHHHGKHKCRHHQRRVKASIQQKQCPKSLSSPRLLRRISGNNVQTSRQQPKTTHHRASSNEESAVITDTVRKADHHSNNKQKVSLSAVREPDTQPKTKTSQRSVPLQSVENKIVSQRETSANEMQVGNCSSCIYTQPTTTTTICTDAAQQFEQIYYEDECCLPTPNIGCATSSCSCIVQQPQSKICISQQQPLACTGGISSTSCLCATSGACSSTTCVCSSGSSGFLQSQPQILYVNNTSPTVCVSQAPPQSITNLVIQQQPQLLTQPLQLIQNSQAQQAQYIQMPSATPQIIQMPRQVIAASPQILYQRPYDSLALPMQNQQIAIGNVSSIPLSYPSYAPPRLLSGSPVQQTATGPQLFRQALVRTVANRTGTPVLTATPMGAQLMQPPIPSPGIGLLTTTARRPLDPDNLPGCSIM